MEQVVAAVPNLSAVRTSTGASWRFVTPLQLSNGLRAFNSRQSSAAAEASLEFLIGLATQLNSATPNTSRDAQFAEARRQVEAKRKALADARSAGGKNAAARTALAAAIQAIETQIQSAITLADFVLAALLLLILTDLLNQLARL
ncbi:MAG: hypothetical protein ABI823_13320 [Bryobacteraceae bacterium]